MGMPRPGPLPLSGARPGRFWNWSKPGQGCTPIDNPAPRWSHYVWLLRGHGFKIETILEDHGGPFSGSHARYLLHDAVTLSGGNLAAWRPGGIRYPSTGRAAA